MRSNVLNHFLCNSLSSLFQIKLQCYWCKANWYWLQSWNNLPLKGICSFKGLFQSVNPYLFERIILFLDLVSADLVTTLQSLSISTLCKLAQDIRITSGVVILKKLNVRVVNSIFFFIHVWRDILGTNEDCFATQNKKFPFVKWCRYLANDSQIYVLIKQFRDF